MIKELYFRGEKDAGKVRLWKERLHGAAQRWKPFRLKQSALLVVDMQNYFLDARSHAFVPSGPAILPNVVKLVRLFRSADRPVVFTYFAVRKEEQDPIGQWWRSTVCAGTPASRIVDELKSEEGEPIIRKSSYNPFCGTELETFLRSADVQGLVVAGVLPNFCCETAVREAFCRGFDAFVPIDATASFTEEMHVSSLVTLSYGFATPLSTEEFLHFS